MLRRRKVEYLLPRTAAEQDAIQTKETSRKVRSFMMTRARRPIVNEDQRVNWNWIVDPRTRAKVQVRRQGERLRDERKKRLI